MIYILRWIHTEGTGSLVHACSLWTIVALLSWLLTDWGESLLLHTSTHGEGSRLEGRAHKNMHSLMAVCFRKEGNASKQGAGGGVMRRSIHACVQGGSMYGLELRGSAVTWG